MNKRCLNCKIEYTPITIYSQFCDKICKKGYRKKWLTDLYQNNGQLLSSLIEKDLRAY